MIETLLLRTALSHGYRGYRGGGREQRSQLGIAAAAAALTGGILLYRAIRTAAYRFTDRVVIITGGSRGLGLVMARQLADEGARLAILARDEEEVRRAADDLTSRGAQVLGLVCDVRDRAQVQQTIQRIVDHFGQIDVLINNAGIISVGPLDHMAMGDFEEAMAIHFWAPLYMIWEAIPHMRRQGEGRIVNISSIGGLVGVPHLHPYCASKFALTGLSDSIRAELREDGIRVTTICPGLMRTGSPINALFKGRHREEYTWFILFDSLPPASISARRAARQILNACRRGDARLIVSIPAKVAALANTVVPELVASGMSLMNRLLLPKTSQLHGKEAHPGRESRSPWAPSLLTRLTERAAERNNELPRPQPTPK